MFYKVAVYFKGERIGVGEACSTKKAQFEAAQNALDKNQSRLFAFYIVHVYTCVDVSCISKEAWRRLIQAW